MNAKAFVMSVNCPYCGTSYTFRSKDKLEQWKQSGRSKPLHPLCIKAQKLDFGKSY